MSAQSQPANTMHATLSLYVPSERMERVFSNWTKNTRKTLRASEARSELSDTIDPLFNDIAIRDRNASVDEFLMRGGHVEPMTIAIPSKIKWHTEGRDFEADLRESIAYDTSARTFWYVHSDGAVSLHISIPFEYQDSLAHYYSLSVLQKLMFPTEASMCGNLVDGDICSGATGRWVLDTRVVRKGTEDFTFWQFVRHLTELQLDKLIQCTEPVNSGASTQQEPILQIRTEFARKPHSDLLRVLWDQLFSGKSSNFLEVPALRAPLARAAFLLRDANLFGLLEPVRRDGLNAKGVYKPFPVDIPITPEKVASVVEVRGSSFDYRYYFLAGFFQNIIDFLNQDVSELRDGTELPIRLIPAQCRAL